MSPVESPEDVVCTLKILVLGDAGVGKSNLVLRLCDDRFDDNLQFTIGIDFRSLRLTVNGDAVQAKIIDTAGQERFHSLTPSTYRNLNGAALVYSVMDIQSFFNVDKWLDQLAQQTQADIPIVLIANVTDRKSDRIVTSEDGRRLAQRLDLQYFEVSAKTGKNVAHAFQSLVTLAYLREKRKQPTNAIERSATLRVSDRNRSKSKGRKKKCCA
uniref:Ras-related protein Rab-9B n=1 Tax=Steinernema glaseri TaxID=37863 RepID=A0A1I7YJA4_9BILA